MLGGVQNQVIAVDERDDVRLRIDNLVSSMKKATVPRELLMSPNCCIFKIPVTHKRHNKNAFIPYAFSIGPLHHEKRNLKATEKIKIRYFQDLISRSPSPETMLSIMINSIMEVEKEAREYYADAIHYKPDEFVKILVIDGCFIIEFFHKEADLTPISEDDPIFTRSCMRSFLYHDLILLENQVPWMILERLFSLTKDPSTEQKPLVTLAREYVKDIFPSYSSTKDPLSDSCIKIEDIKHFLGLLREFSISPSTNPPPNQSIYISGGANHFVRLFRKLSTLPSTLFGKLQSLLSSSTEKEKRRREWEQVPSATSLDEAGVKFKGSNTSQSILDIEFEDGVLKIPPLGIDDLTETLFRNLISYEQCLPCCEHRFTSYAMFLDNLIITTKDMNILCENQIIDNWLNPEDATQLFNKLYYDTCVFNYYKKLCGDVNRYCERRWPRWRAMLVRNYFNNPWAVLSTSAAVILLILTLLQTVYGIRK